MLSAEYKAEMIQSLKDDYVVLTDVFVEMVADTKADMFRLEQEGYPLMELQKDREFLRKLERAYIETFKTTPKKAVDVFEQIYELSKKYDKLRIGD